MIFSTHFDTGRPGNHLAAARAIFIFIGTTMTTTSPMSAQMIIPMSFMLPITCKEEIGMYTNISFIYLFFLGFSCTNGDRGSPLRLRNVPSS